MQGAYETGTTNVIVVRQALTSLRWCRATKGNPGDNAPEFCLRGTGATQN